MPPLPPKMLAGLRHRQQLARALAHGRPAPHSAITDGPLTDHWDGTRFGDAHSGPPKSSSTCGAGIAENNKVPIGRRIVDNDFADKPPARVEGNAWRICHVGHATNLIQTAGLNILTDPGPGRNARRHSRSPA